MNYVQVPNLVLTEQSTTIHSLNFHPNDPTQLVSGSEFTPVHLWKNLSTTSTQSSVSFEVLEQSYLAEVVYAAEYDPTGRYLAVGFSSCSLPGIIQLWDLLPPSNETSPTLLSSWETTSRDVWSLAYSPDGSTLASGYQDEPYLRLWNITDILQGGHPFDSVIELEGHLRTVKDVEFRDATILASGSGDGTVHFWNISNPKSVEKIYTLEHEWWVEAVAFSPDGSVIATAGGQGMIKLWNATNYTLLAGLGESSTSSVRDLEFLPTSSYPHLVSAAQNGVTVWNYREFRKEFYIAPFSDSVTFNSEGSQLAIGGLGTIQFWNLLENANTTNPAPVDDNIFRPPSPPGANTPAPIVLPSKLPSVHPSLAPSTTLSSSPSYDPTVSPTAFPSNAPTIGPTNLPSALPSRQPSFEPSIFESDVPSEKPSTGSNNVPSTMPTETSGAQYIGRILPLNVLIVVLLCLLELPL